MSKSSLVRASRALIGAALVASAPLIAGCDDSAPAPPVPSDAEIQKQQAAEQEARQRAYGKSGNPQGRNPGKAAAKDAAKGAAKAP